MKQSRIQVERAKDDTMDRIALLEEFGRNILSHRLTGKQLMKFLQTNKWQKQVQKFHGEFLIKFPDFEITSLPDFSALVEQHTRCMWERSLDDFDLVAVDDSLLTDLGKRLKEFSKMRLAPIENLVINARG